MTTLPATLDALKDTFTELHTRKEDLFWAAKMGLTDDPARTQREHGEAEIAMNRFLQDPQRLATLRDFERRGEGTAAERHVLAGWVALFAANTIESPEGRKLSEEIVEREGELQQARGKMKLGFTDPETGEWVEASSNRLALLMRNDPSAARRKAAFEAMRSIEDYVMEHGFLEIVKRRNALGRALGHEDYYAWRVAVVERMAKRDLFAALGDLAARTTARAKEELARFEREHGDGSLEPYNFLFLRAGKIAAELDPYFSFGRSLRRWGVSFMNLGVRFRGATLTLDLVDRAGKYENGFMHGPEPAFFDHGAWRPARINFTANAVPGAVGSGLRATETLFHEGGHAAHFSNILSDAPCFAQEFAPTSVAYAETQSMFMDSLLEDADWRTRYLADGAGNPIPLGLLEDAIREAQPMRAWDVRAMLTVPMAERALYEIPDAELTPERVKTAFRAIERDLQGLTGGVRPVLAVPHLLSGEASAYYHGYVMAEMAVFQTRAHFLARDGHLVDNPRVGPDLAEHYWKPGNAATFNETLTALTGSALSADALVAACNLGADDAIAAARAQVARLPSIAHRDGPVDMDMKLRVIHGREAVAGTDGGTFEAACDAFERWIGEG
ncbi:MAG: M3 family metallopeptidase [Polyangiales bacterium]